MQGLDKLEMPTANQILVRNHAGMTPLDLGVLKYNTKSISQIMELITRY